LKAVLILSGEADSSTLGYWLKNEGYTELICITYNYDQKQIIEIESAKKIAKNLNASHRIIDIKADSANNSILIPNEGCTKENKSITTDTSLLLSIAWTIACEEKADVLAYGAYSGDYQADFDICLNYFNAMNLALRSGTEKSRKDNLKLIIPFIHKSTTKMMDLVNNF
jgi:7-cyano-7-deazaguanine synthase in queuosine biosynthesis